MSVRLTIDEINSLVYTKCMVEIASLDRGDLGRELGAVCQLAISTLEKLIAHHAKDVAE